MTLEVVEPTVRGMKRTMAIVVVEVIVWREETAVGRQSQRWSGSGPGLDLEINK